MKKVLNKKGISLIVLVITIVIMIILAGAVILTLVNSGIIGQTQIGLFKNNVASYKAELATYISDALVRGTINVNGEDIEFKPEEFSRDNNLIQEYITSMSDTDVNRFAIIQGQLVYISYANVFTDEEIQALKDIGVRPLEYNYEENIGTISAETDYSGQTIYINPKPVLPEQDFTYMIANQGGDVLLYMPEEVGETIMFAHDDGSVYQYFPAGRTITASEYDGYIINGKMIDATEEDEIVFSFGGWCKVIMDESGENVVGVYSVLPESIPNIVSSGYVGDSADSISGLENYASLAPYVIVP